MSDSSGNSGSVFTLSRWAARRMGHDVDEKDSWCPVIGFRVVFDTEVRHPPTRADVGSMSIDTASECRFMYTDCDESDHTNRHLGFRLAKENT